MYDFQFYASCDHRVSEIISIEGTSPNYFADLPYRSNLNRDNTSILELNGCSETSLYGAQLDGITNYYYSSDGTQILFGLYPVSAGMEFPDINVDYVPPKVYFFSYSTLLEDCPKCGGNKKTFDVHFDTANRVKLIEKREKIRQQLVKILLTNAGDNLLDSEYGCTLSDSIGQKINEYFAANLQFSIIEAINHLVDIQNNYNLPDTERITSVSDVTATQNADDPREINIVVKVTTADYEEVSTNFILRV